MNITFRKRVMHINVSVLAYSHYNLLGHIFALSAIDRHASKSNGQNSYDLYTAY